MLQKGGAGWLQYPLPELVLQGCILYSLIFVLVCGLVEKQHFSLLLRRGSQSCLRVG